MAGCSTPLNVFIPRGFDYKEIKVKCGNTSPNGEPWLCQDCERIYADTDWRRLAAENGEAWDENDY